MDLTKLAKEAEESQYNTNFITGSGIVGALAAAGGAYSVDRDIYRSSLDSATKLETGDIEDEFLRKMDDLDSQRRQNKADHRKHLRKAKGYVADSKQNLQKAVESKKNNIDQYKNEHARNQQILKRVKDQSNKTAKLIDSQANRHADLRDYRLSRIKHSEVYRDAEKLKPSLRKLMKPSSLSAIGLGAGIGAGAGAYLSSDLVDAGFLRGDSPREIELPKPDIDTDFSTTQRVGMGVTGLGALNAATDRVLGRKRLFHGTTKDNATSILRDGLLADRGGSGASQAVGDLDYVKNSRGHVHVTGSKPFANFYSHVGDKNGFFSQLRGAVEAGEAPSGAAGKKMHRDMVKGTLIPNKETGRVLSMNIPYEDYSRFQLDADGGPSKHFAAKTTENIDPKYIRGSKKRQSLSALAKETTKNLPAYIRNNPKRFATGAGLTGLGGGLVGLSLQGLGDKEEEGKEATVNMEGLVKLANDTELQSEQKRNMILGGLGGAAGGVMVSALSRRGGKLGQAFGPPSIGNDVVGVAGGALGGAWGGHSGTKKKQEKEAFEFDLGLVKLALFELNEETMDEDDEETQQYFQELYDERVRREQVSDQARAQLDQDLLQQEEDLENRAFMRGAGIGGGLSALGAGLLGARIRPDATKLDRGLRALTYAAPAGLVGGTAGSIVGLGEVQPDVKAIRNQQDPERLEAFNRAEDYVNEQRQFIDEEIDRIFIQ